LAEHVHDLREAGAARDFLIDAAREAGRLALGYFRPGQQTAAQIRYKAGGSPVSEADLAVDALLRRRLSGALPDAGWLSEETEDDPSRLQRSRLFVVDPIDGTRAFIAGDPRWTVSLALIAEGRPVAGVVFAPALEETYAAALGGGATLNDGPIAVSSRGGLDGARIGGPRSMVESLQKTARLSLALEPKIPSLAYRIARVAAGALDLAIASENSHDWDVAAADLILAEAGGALVEGSGLPLTYNREETRHPVLLAASRPLIQPFVAAIGLARDGRKSTLALVRRAETIRSEP
jgi:myo-inositol-1(or 4)-monophosphatase